MKSDTLLFYLNIYWRALWEAHLQLNSLETNSCRILFLFTSPQQHQNWQKCPILQFHSNFKSLCVLFPWQFDDCTWFRSFVPHSVFVLQFCSIILMQQMCWRQQKFPVKCASVFPGDFKCLLWLYVARSISVCFYDFCLFSLAALRATRHRNCVSGGKAEKWGGAGPEWLVEWQRRQCRWLAARNQSKTVASIKERKKRWNNKRLGTRDAHQFVCRLARVLVYVCLCVWRMCFCSCSCSC